MPAKEANGWEEYQIKSIEKDTENTGLPSKEQEEGIGQIEEIPAQCHLP